MKLENYYSYSTSEVALTTEPRAGRDRVLARNSALMLGLYDGDLR